MIPRRSASGVVRNDGNQNKSCRQTDRTLGIIQFICEMTSSHVLLCNYSRERVNCYRNRISPFFQSFFTILSIFLITFFLLVVEKFIYFEVAVANRVAMTSMILLISTTTNEDYNFQNYNGNVAFDG